jgi:hypothetical protein
MMTALDSVPGMKEVSVQSTDPVTALMAKGIVHIPAHDQFIYHTETADRVVEMMQDENGIERLRLYCGWMNYTPPEAKVEATRKLMDVVYRHLRSQIPDLPPAEELQERLFRLPK